MEQSIENLYKLDGRVPVGKALPFGLQHVLAMFVSNIAPIMILAGAIGLDSSVSAVLIQNCMVIAGIGTLVQLYPVWRIGSRLPIVMGISFTFLSLAIAIAGAHGMGTLIGAVIIGGLVEGTLGLFAKYWIKLFKEAIQYRNQLVAASFEIAKEGFEHALNEFTPEVLNVAGTQDFFYNKYLKPQIEAITKPLHTLSSLEEAYFCRMMTFVLREQMISKVGAQEGTNTSSSDLWTMPLTEKKDAGNIYTDLHIIRKEQSCTGSGYDTITLSVPDQGKDFLPNFRIGDMVYLYTYKLKEEPDVRKAILYKGVLQEIHSDEIVVHLTDGQQNADIFETNLPYAIEHGTSDASTGGSICNLHQFICAPKDKRDLLLGQRVPERDTSQELTRHYDDVLDDIILRAKQAQDYFLLVGPPGTGKTSRALKFMVEEALNDGTGKPTAESIAAGGGE
jgi:DNA replication ATP-dependent helicase Dna2